MLSLLKIARAGKASARGGIACPASLLVTCLVKFHCDETIEPYMAVHFSIIIYSYWLFTKTCPLGIVTKLIVIASVIETSS